MDRSAADELVAFEVIRQLKAKYCRFVDTKQWELLQALFTPDACLEGFGSVPDGSSPAEFVDGVSKRLQTATTIHHVQAPEIALLGPDTARGIWSMMDYVQFAADQPVSDQAADRGWRGWGYYEEEYARDAGEWRITYMRLVRQRMDWLAADHPQPTTGRHAPRPDWL